MRHHHRRAANHQAIQRVLHDTLALRVKRARRLVQKEHAGVLQDRASDRDALLLTAAHLNALLTNVRVVPLRKRADEAVRVRRLGGGNNLILRRIRLAKQDVLADRRREQRRLLRHKTNLRTQPAQVKLPHVLAVQEHAAGLRVVEALNQAHGRALAAPGLAHQGHGLAGINGQREIAEHNLVRPRWVGKRDILELDNSPGVLQGDTSNIRFNVGRSGQYAKHAPTGHLACLEVLDVRRGLAERDTSDEGGKQYV
mmetsp:Transcript_7570/g.20637  ORF Transcript_7570/g.20637 Transcript_7570/m.20637 type:complete len:255 (-) Transcript_7570:1167-1931(-)